MVRDPAWWRTEGLAGMAGDELDDAQRAALKAEFEPGERVLWAERAGPPPSPTIGVFPAFFAAVLCGASGFALMVLFGIYGIRPMGPGEMVFFLCLPPGAIGLVTGIGLVGKWVQHARTRWHLAHTFYALTDRRAIVGSDAHSPGEIAIGFFTSDMFDATLCVEYRDGSGDVFFVQDGDVAWPEWGFRGISGAKRVEGLVRRVLLGIGPEPGPEDGSGLGHSQKIIPAGD
jgi:hypothetical protein